MLHSDCILANVTEIECAIGQCYDQIWIWFDLGPIFRLKSWFDLIWFDGSQNHPCFDLIWGEVVFVSIWFEFAHPWTSYSGGSTLVLATILLCQGRKHDCALSNTTWHTITTIRIPIRAGPNGRRHVFTCMAKCTGLPLGSPNARNGNIYTTWARS